MPATRGRRWDEEISSWWAAIDRHGHYGAQAHADDEDPSHQAHPFSVEDPLPAHLERPAQVEGHDEEDDEDALTLMVEGLELRLSCAWRKGLRHGHGLLWGPALEKVGIRYLQRPFYSSLYSTFLFHSFLAGSFKRGCLDGLGRAKLTDGITLEGAFAGGRLHGLVRGRTDDGHLTMVGQFADGRAVGPFWRLTEGGGYLYGGLNERGLHGGPTCAYIYPDAAAALVGSFDSCEMISAHECRIEDLRRSGHSLKATFSEAESADLFRFSPSTLLEVKCPHLRRDPLEKRTVEVSCVTPHL